MGDVYEKERARLPPGGFVKADAEDGMEVTAWQAGVTAPGMPWGRGEA
jgi:hypothetical protein